MAASATEARKALERAEGGTSARAATRQLAAAIAALDRFIAIHKDIIALSRRNSDVRSLALSLGRKRMVTAECEDQLRRARRSDSRSMSSPRHDDALATSQDASVTNRYPTQGSLRRYFGVAGSGSIFFRSCATSVHRCSGCSTAFGPQTAFRMVRCVNTRSWLRASSDRSSNSFGVSRISVPSRTTRRRS